LKLTGPGGIGKTRLALESARGAVDEYADGVWLVELAALADPCLVIATLADVVGIDGEAGVPLAQTVAEVLAAQSILVVLDNCEHVINGCSELATHLLRGCEHLRILATSREPLGVDGEQVWQVPPLTLPGSVDLAILDGFGAARLFDCLSSARART
jgi:predicted ATPase